MIDRWFARSKYYGPILSLCVLIFSGYVETQTHTSQLPDTPKKPTPPELRLNGHGMDEADFAKPKRSTVPAIGVHGGHEILKVLDIQAQNAYFSSDAHTDVPFAFYLPQLLPRANNSLDQFSPANSMHRIPSDEFSLNHPGAIRPVILSHPGSDTAYIQTTPPELGNGIYYSPFDHISHVVKRQLSENAVSEIGPFYETNQTKSAEKTRTSENKSAEREHYHNHSKPPQKKKTDLKTTITTIVIISVLVLVFVCGLCYYFPVLHIFSCCKPAPPPTSPRRRPVGIAKKSTEKTDSSLSSKSKKQKTKTKQKQEHFNNALKPTISMPLYELQEHLDCLSDTTSLMSESTTDRLTPRNEATTPVLSVRSSRRADTRVNPTFSNPAGTSPQHLSKRTTTSPTHHLQVETNKKQASHAIPVEKGRSVVNENHLKTLPSIIEDYKPPNRTSPRLQAQSPQINRDPRRASPFAGGEIAPMENSPTFSVNHKTSMINNNAAPATSGRPSLVRADSPRSTVASTVNSAQNKLNRENPSVHTTQKPQISSLRASQLPAHRGLKGNVEATRSPKMAAPRIIVSNDEIEISDL